MRHTNLMMIALVVALVSLMTMPAVAESVTGEFSFHSTFQDQTGSQAWNHNGGQTISWTLNASYYGDNGWYISPAMQQNGSAFSEWQFASKHWNLGTYTQSKSGTIKFYNASSRTAATKIGEGTLTYTYLGTGNYGVVNLHMNTRLPSGSQFYPSANTVWTTISDSDLGSIGSDYIGAGYSGQNFLVPKIAAGPEGPVTGSSYGYNRWLIEGDWSVDYNATITELYSTYTITPRTGVFRTWSVSADGSIASPLSAWSGNSMSNTTFTRELVYVQDPFVNSTGYNFWVGAPAEYNLTMTPKNISAGQSSTAVISSSSYAFYGISAYTMNCNPGRCFYNGKDPTFLLTGGQWKQWNPNTSAYDITYGASFPSAIPITFDTAGEISIEVVLIPSILSEEGARLHDTVNVGSIGGSTKTLTVRAVDMSSNALISNSEIGVKAQDGTWTNRTSGNGLESFPVLENTFVGYTASHSEYIPSGTLFTKITGDKTVDVLMSKSRIPANASSASYMVWVKDARSLRPLSGAGVSATATGYTASQTTGESGSVIFEPPNGASVTFTASKAGYQTLTRVETVVGNTSGLSMELWPGTAITPTPVPTNPATGEPIVTQVTEDPYPCDADHPENCQRKDTDLVNDIRNNWMVPLVYIFLIGTVACVVKFSIKGWFR